MDYFPPRFRENDERQVKRNNASDPPRSPTGCYNLMVAGMRSGKTSFLRLMLDTCTIAQTATKDQLASVAKFVQGSSCHTSNIRTTCIDVDVDVGTGHPRIALTLVDTPSIDIKDTVSADRVVSDIFDDLEARLEEALQDERKADQHIHLCIYFLDPDVIIPPSGPGAQLLQLPRPRSNSYSKAEMVILEPPVSSNPFLCRAALPQSEITNIRKLSTRVNVLPVIARADTLSNDRLIAIKTAIRRDLAESGIGFGIFDLDADIHAQDERHSSSSPLSGAPSPIPRLPYAMISPDQYSHSDGVSRMPTSRQELVNQYTPSPDNLLNSNLARGRFLRSYRWGSLDVLDANHSDFLPLRKAIFYHMETLQNYTHQYLFANYKQECQQKQQQRSLPSHFLPPLTKVYHPPPPPPHRPVLAIDTAAPPTANRPAHAPQQIGIGVEINGVSDHSASRGSKPSAAKNSKQQRKKITVACNFCRARKLKCDGERPQCGQCVKRSNPCDYMHDRRRKNGRPDQGEDSGSEEASDQPEYGEHSQSPEVQNVPLSRRSSNVGTHNREIYQAASNSRRRQQQPPSDGSPPMSPPTSRPSTSSGGRSFFENDLPQIATLGPIADPSPATPMSAPSFPLIRPNTENPAAQRKRASTVPGKTATPSAARDTIGGKIVACNFCRTRKTKCDGMVPACSSCQRRSLPCNYVHSSGAKRGGTRRASTSKVASTPTSSASSGPSYHSRRRDSDATLHEYEEYSESPPLKKMRIDEPALVGTVP